MENNTEEKEVIEITDEILEKEEKEVPKKIKKKFSFKNLSKKQKIIILMSVTLVLIIGIVLIIYFVLLNDKDEEVVQKEEPVVLEMNNYRYEDGTLIFLDASDNEIGTYECNLKDENKCMISSYTQDSTLTNVKYVNEEKELLEFDMPIFNERYVFVTDDEVINLYDIKNNEVIDTYKLVKRYNGNNVIVLNSEDMYGVLNLDGEEVTTTVEFKYDSLAYLEGTESISYSVDDKYGIINKDGTVAVSNISKEIVSYNNSNILAVGSNSNYTLVDKDNNKLLDDSYDFIKVTNEFIYLIEDNKLYIRDNNMNKLNEEVIELTPVDDYNEYVIYDENFSKKGEENSFEITLTEEKVLSVKYADKTYSVNTYEGVLNNKYEYVNYLNGYIYIYDDAEKESLSGSYKCENANNVKSDSTVFDNCFVALESDLNGEGDPSGFVPIYSEKYIFVMDKKSGVTKDNIYLIDYKETDESKKEKANYAKVDVNFNGEAGKITKAASASNLLIMAENTSGNLGMIKMDGTTVSSYIRFLYTSIKEYNDTYIVKETDGSYHIMYHQDNFVTDEDASITNEIISYGTNYIKTKDSSGKFVLYSFSGKVISKQLDEIIAKDNLFLGVSGNEIEVYRYTDGTDNILKTDVTKEGSVLEFIDNGTNGFIITMKDDSDKILSTYSFDQNGVIK